MTVYIRPEERDTRYPLWHVLYECKVPYIQSMSLEELKKKGIYVSGVSAYDHATAWEPRLMSIPVVRIIELWHNEANVYLLHPEKHVWRIYEDIQKHLFAWTEHVNATYNLRNYPEEELKIMDAFNSMLYEHVKWIEKKQTWDGMLASRKTSASIASFSQFWDKRDKEKNERERIEASKVGGRYEPKNKRIDFVVDPESHLEQIKNHMQKSHAGKEALDIHPARTTWSDIMQQYGGRRNDQ